jgi:CheY-like chemotaxis protein
MGDSCTCSEGAGGANGCAAPGTEPCRGGARIVALTGWGQAEDRQRTADAGFDDHLTKPADPGEIQRILEEVAVRVRD